METISMNDKLISRPGFARFLALGAALIGTSRPAAAASVRHHIVFHVDRNEPATMNLLLNNIANVTTYYSGVGEPVDVEVVAYGPGLHMLREDTSPVKERLTSIKASIPEVIFSACGVTMKGMEKAEGHPISLVPQARIVPAGVVRLTQLHEQGWTYIKP